MTTTLPDTTASDSSTDGVIPSISREALLARRNAAVALLTSIRKSVSDYQGLADLIFGTKPDEGPYRSAPYKWREPVNQRCSGHGRDLDDDRWLDDAIRSVDAALWDHLLDESGLRSYLDSKARNEWDEQIKKNKTPPLTEENIRATFTSLHAQRGDFFERGVVEIFRGLSWDYKSNRPNAFGKKIIASYIVDRDGRPGQHRSNVLDDLERAMYVLDKKPEPDHRTNLRSRLWRREPAHAPVENPYFTLRTFQNGNGHILFKRLDLVDELNRIIAKHFPDALPHHRQDPAEHRPSAAEGLVRLHAPPTAGEEVMPPAASGLTAA